MIITGSLAKLNIGRSYIRTHQNGIFGRRRTENEAKYIQRCITRNSRQFEEFDNREHVSMRIILLHGPALQRTIPLFCKRL